MGEKFVRASTKRQALKNFRKLTPDKYTATNATRVVTSDGIKYKIRFRLKKGEY